MKTLLQIGILVASYIPLLFSVSKGDMDLRDVVIAFFFQLIILHIITTLWIDRVYLQKYHAHCEHLTKLEYIKRFATQLLMMLGMYFLAVYFLYSIQINYGDVAAAVQWSWGAFFLWLKNGIVEFFAQKSWIFILLMVGHLLQRMYALKQKNAYMTNIDSFLEFTNSSLKNIIFPLAVVVIGFAPYFGVSIMQNEKNTTLILIIVTLCIEILAQWNPYRYYINKHVRDANEQQHER